MASVGSSRHVRAKPVEEEKVVINRTTRSGRKLQYEMAVMQQPERARACGSGAKSSADRRPVDPPPVVELKVFEINSEGCQVDITFAYNANFFLFATLESRPIARGRVAAPATPQNPVLTGMPVSGMAYLDRPREAGYFIFPDLSVRHEGQYRLSFNLYEQTNKPEEDGDVEPALDVKSGVSTDSKAQEPESSFDWRMEIKSKVFDVFSAKKFPGLAESTHLSRVVAEQGCRVRIRRDVRMRRRVDGKGADEFESAGGDQYSRGRAESIAVDSQRRDRSLSVSSHGSVGDAQGRRNSGELYQAPPGGNLGFRLPQESQPFAQPQLMPQQPHQPHYHNPPYQQPQYAPAHAPQHPGHYAPPPHPQSAHPQSAHPSFPSQRDHIYDDPQRRQSMAGHPSEHFSRYPHEQSYARHAAPPQPYPAHSPQLNVLPPINSKMDYDPSPAGPLPPARQLAPIAPAVHSPPRERRDERRPSQYPDFSDSLMPDTPRNGNKRAYNDTFSTDTSSHPLRNGQRPPSFDDDDGDDSDDETQPIMSYKRATGAVQSRALPAVN